MAALAFAASCSSVPVRVAPRDAQALHRDLDQCALHGDVPSGRTAWLLRLLEAEEGFEEDPVGTLKRLHQIAVVEGRREGLFALAELSYLAGKRLQVLPGEEEEESRKCFLAAVVYSYLYLLGTESSNSVSPYDRRFRWACDIYNRSLVRALKSPDDGSLRLEPGMHDLPVGSLQMDVDLTAFPFETQGLELMPADELKVIGLGFRVRDAGLGAPLIAVVQRPGEGTAGVGILDRTSVSATLFLRLRGGLHAMADELPAVLELHSTYDAKDVEVAGTLVPLETDPSATIAYGIQSSNLWQYDLAGLFRGRDAMRQNGLILPRPFEKGRIPVVLVHGTASNPAYWAEIWNSLHADPIVRERFQFWLFIYTTGNPIAYSAATLREALQKIVQEHDPDGRDEALKHMVVVGHSQGGLLTKMTGVHLDADKGVQRVLGTSMEDLDLDEEGEQLLRRCFDVEPLPFVDRLVFMATPHGGSFLAARWYSRFLAKLIAVPGELEKTTHRIVRRVPKERLPQGMATRVPTSLDNMDPANTFLGLLRETPIDPRIHAHSIIPIGDAEEPAGADDGVVEYESAHLEGVDSEMLVPSGHSCQSHPRTIIELRRILREHIEAIDAPVGAP